MKIISVVGARPNFMKVAPFIHTINEHNKLKDRANNYDRDIKKMKREILELLEN